ncbi:Dynamitin-domain-containing protein [Pisolithus croceorrhizus]|nr:Dynamitin-domain-containing protein [Pisolithus croceorrhizus]
MTMSANKYANLPDIDTAPDVYETEDVIPSSHTDNGDSTDDEPSVVRTRTRAAGDATLAGREELDTSNLISAEEASKHFRKAERKRRQRTRYTYPPSPSSSRSCSTSRSSSPTRHLSLPARLRVLQAELAALEAELADPSNPALQAREKSGDVVDPGEMIMGLVDVRERLAKVRNAKEGRGKLVSVVLGENYRGGVGEERDHEGGPERNERDMPKGSHVKDKDGNVAPERRSITEMDKRVGELEKLIGSVNVTLDETTPLTPPLLPMLMRLNNQLTLLTQPRHIDSVSRRLKLLLSDLERASTNQAQKRQNNMSQQDSQSGSTPAQDVVLPLLSRLAPSLPHIPHILTRLRTLSALHGSAAEFQSTVAALEEEQKRTREALDALKTAVESVEGSLEANRNTVAGNVGSLEGRVDNLLNRLESLSK